MADTVNAVKVWDEVLGHLRNEMTLATFGSVFNGSQAGFYDGEVLEVGLSSKQGVAWASERLAVVVERVVKYVVGRPVRVRFSTLAGAAGTGPLPERPPAEQGPDGVDVGDRRRVRWYRVDNVVLDDYLPLMGIKAFAVYSLYCRMSGRDGLSWPGYTYICKTLRIGRATVAECNAVLEALGLIEIERGNVERSNRYYLLEPETLTESTLLRIRDSANRAGIEGLIRAVEVVLNGNYPSSEPEPDQFSTGTRLVLNQNYPSSEPELEQDISNKTQEQDKGTRGSSVKTVDFNSDEEAVTWLVQLGVTRVVASKMVQDHSRRWLSAWASYTVAQKSIKDPPAFLVKKVRGRSWPPGHEE